MSKTQDAIRVTITMIMMIIKIANTGSICSFINMLKLTAHFVSTSRCRCFRLPPSNRRICENYKRIRANWQILLLVAYYDLLRLLDRVIFLRFSEPAIYFRNEIIDRIAASFSSLYA